MRVPARSVVLRVLTPVALLALLLAVPTAGGAATPDKGSIGPSPDPASTIWQGPQQTAVTSGPDACSDAGAYCDDFMLTVTAAPAYWDTHSGGADVKITWATASNDFDLYIYDASGANLVAQSAGSASTSEDAFVPAASGTYLVRVVYFTVVASGYTGTATFVSQTGTGGATFDSTSVAFAPSTVVSAHFLGAEPQTTLERRIPDSPSSIDPNRIFVDWPLSTRTQTGQLSRSLDGGNTFRMLLDLTCAERNRPNCATGGGGDTENEVNIHTGTLFFSDQEVTAGESLSSSIDHGDTFPVTRQFAITNQTTVVDRQWVGATDTTDITVPPDIVEAFLAYHVPGVGQYIQGIDQNGVPIPQPAPQLQFVAQSGPIRVDHTNGPGHGWVYQSYRSFLGHPQGASHFFVATAYGPDFQSPTAWKDNKVTDDNPAIFPWISLDSHGNAYAVWVTGGVMYYSASAIDDKANNPDLGGRPGTFWTPRVRVDLPSVGSAVFPEVVGGGPGRIAITYDGTTQFTGVSDDAPAGTQWHTYGAVIRNALQVDGPAVVSTGIVDHRVIHVGSICTSGTTCTGDRSLLDMIDIGRDQSGRPGIVFTDNNSTFQSSGGPDATKDSPFTLFAKMTQGPSLLAGKPSVDVAIPTGARKDRAGDATWPNTAAGQNLTSLDELKASLTLSGSNLVAKVRLANASVAQMQQDLIAYNAVIATTPPAERLQYVVRFASGSEIYHLSLETLADGTQRAFGGILDANDRITPPTSTATVAAGYHTDAGFRVSFSLKNGALVLTAPASAFGVSAGTQLFSVTAFSMAGPAEATELSTVNVMRTVDAMPPFDVTL